MGMLVSVLQENLIAGLTMIMPEYGTRPDTEDRSESYQPQSWLKLTAEEGRLKLFAPSGSVIFVGAKIDLDGTVVLPFWSFLDYVKLLPPERIDLREVEGKLHLEVGTWVTSNWKLRELEKFPAIASDDGVLVAKVPAVWLVAALRRVMKAAKKSDRYLAVRNVYFQRTEGGLLRLLAADGSNAVVIHSHFEIVRDFQITVEECSALMKIAARDLDGDVYLALTKSELVASTLAAQARFRLSDEHFRGDPYAGFVIGYQPRVFGHVDNLNPFIKAVNSFKKFNDAVLGQDSLSASHWEIGTAERRTDIVWSAVFSVTIAPKRIGDLLGIFTLGTAPQAKEWMALLAANPLDSRIELRVTEKTFTVRRGCVELACALNREKDK